LGDNLAVLSGYISDEAVDLIYLDPPFNSNRTYNIFKRVDGSPAAAQIKAFDDTWHWSLESERTFRRTVEKGGDVSRVLRAFREVLDTSDMLAYLTMMAPRLVELHRVLKSTGSIYLHCDPTASHYLKLLMDAVFGAENFGSEVIWKRTTAHSDGAQGRKLHGHIHDVLLFYRKSDKWTWNTISTPYDQSYIDSHYRFVEEGTGRRFRKDNLTAAKPGGDTSYEWRGARPYKGRYWAYSRAKMEHFEAKGHLVYTRTGMPELKRYLDEMPGVPLQDVWTDIEPINARARERLGYPTQKPLALLERIIATSSNEGDVVLDPFCGCGTAIEAAQALGRRWIGIDITKVALEVIDERLGRSFPDLAYSVRFMPTSMEEVDVLASRDKFAFQQWVCDKLGIEADIRKGADRGIDGEIVRYMLNDKAWRAVVSVKGGSVNVTQLRDLRGTVERERADVGIFVTYKLPTKPMREEAIAAGLTKQGIPKLQILTAEELLNGQMPALPVPVAMTMRGPDVVAEPERTASIGSRRRITA
jgi:DNA modification methylase